MRRAVRPAAGANPFGGDRSGTRWELTHNGRSASFDTPVRPRLSEHRRTSELEMPATERQPRCVLALTLVHRLCRTRRAADRPRCFHFVRKRWKARRRVRGAAGLRHLSALSPSPGRRVFGGLLEAWSVLPAIAEEHHDGPVPRRSFESTSVSRPTRPVSGRSRRGDLTELIERPGADFSARPLRGESGPRPATSVVPSLLIPAGQYSPTNGDHSAKRVTSVFEIFIIPLLDGSRRCSLPPSP